MKKIDVKECASLLKEYDNYLILSHRHPDGDTLGSAFALKRALDLLGKKSMVRCNDEMPSKFSYLWQGIDNSEIKFDKIIAVDDSGCEYKDTAFIYVWKDFWDINCALLSILEYIFLKFEENPALKYKSKNSFSSSDEISKHFSINSSLGSSYAFLPIIFSTIIFPFLLVKISSVICEVSYISIDTLAIISS